MNTASEAVVGIDLGTTFSAIAWVDEQDRLQVVPNAEGDNITPSLALLEGDTFIVGRAAQSQAIARPNDVARCIKRLMGEDYKFHDRWTPEEISAEILKKLVTDASEHLGRQIKRAVITVPAYFNANQRALTQKAGELAGLKVEETLDEPEAAAIFFGVSTLKDGERVLVCDLGGGTYDATILLLKNGVLKAERTRGSRELGGHDWTNVLVDVVAERVTDKIGANPKDDLFLWQLLYDRCEDAKRQLSMAPSVRIPWSQNGQAMEVTVDRKEFEERCTGLIQQVLDKTTQVVDDAGLTMKDIQHVLLVGGSSRLPSFVQAITDLTGNTPKRTNNPDEAVARGAALVAHGYARGNVQQSAGRITVMTGKGPSQSRLVVQRTTVHALGTRVVDFDQNPPAIVSDAIIGEGTALPASGEKTYYLQPNQTTFQVPVIELDSHGQTQCEWANYRFFNAPSRSTKSAIKVRFQVTAIKLPNVVAIDVQTGQELQSEKMAYKEPEAPDKMPSGGTEPATVVLAVDCSGSMIGSKLTEAKKAVSEVAEKYAAKGWSIALVNFGGPSSIYPASILARPTTSAAQVIEATNFLIADGGTPLEAGMDRIREILEMAPGKRVTIIITDGQPNDIALTQQRAQTLKAQRIIIGTVPIGSDANKEFLTSIGDLESSIQADDRGHGTSAAVLDILAKL